MTTRRRAREIVLQLLYEEDLHPEQDAALAEQFLKKRLHGNRPLVEFGRQLFRNVLANRKEIDKALSAKATNWSLRRMAAIDRNVLRMGAYELLMTDTPGPVVINEAVALAKRYGDRQSGQFVNGILDRVLHRFDDAAGKAGGDDSSGSGLPGSDDTHQAAADRSTDAAAGITSSDPATLNPSATGSSATGPASGNAHRSDSAATSPLGARNQSSNSLGAHNSQQVREKSTAVSYGRFQTT